eukprot:CAMPEP_0171637536 /NCGR_PEP_ID=MMETSP0990-20121206/28276_1 /TAXON_ID=483369 /ORGANISM="non described non described, Strain CCMP2098" /LENGTH=129 /DNA_ID=CAMNT_0012210301 /DNA_START=178 /DNA_END=567 /DNA_ORIENTATION=-
MGPTSCFLAPVELRGLFVSPLTALRSFGSTPPQARQGTAGPTSAPSSKRALRAATPAPSMPLAISCVSGSPRKNPSLAFIRSAPEGRRAFPGFGPAGACKWRAATFTPMSRTASLALAAKRPPGPGRMS